MKSLILMGSPRKRGNTAALLDRLVYGRNKFYGEEKGPSLWAESHWRS